MEQSPRAAREECFVTQYRKELHGARTEPELKERWLDVEDAEQFFHVITIADVAELRGLFNERLAQFHREPVAA